MSLNKDKNLAETDANKQTNLKEKQLDKVEENNSETQVEQVKQENLAQKKATNQTNEEEATENFIKEINADAISNFKLAESLISNLYENIFSKSANFKPTKNQTIGDLLIYIGYRAKSVGVYDKFKNIFKVELNEDSVRSSENYIPSAIKLTVYIDKKQDECYTKKIVGYILKTILYLFDDINDDKVISLTVNSMGAVYSYLIDNDINVN